MRKKSWLATTGSYINKPTTNNQQPTTYYRFKTRIETMAKHHPDLVMCRKQPGVAIGRVCEKCKFLLRHVLMFGNGAACLVVFSHIQ